MIEGNDIIFFANDWDADPLSKKHIVCRLAQRNRVLWVNSLVNRNMTASARDLRRAGRKVWQFCRGCGKVAENIFVFSPVVIPFHGSPLVRWMNCGLLASSLRRVCAQLGFHKPITWSFMPTSADVVGSLGERLLICHCVDEFSKFAGANEVLILAMERRLMRKADLVIVSSSRLDETKRQYNSNTALITHGVDVEHFRQACGEELPRPPGYAGLRRPVIGFFGLIAEWVDLETLQSMAIARTEECFQQIEACLSHGIRGPDLSVSRSMDLESWDHKVEEMSDRIAALSATQALEPVA